MEWIKCSEPPKINDEYLTTDGYSFHISYFKDGDWFNQYQGHLESEFWLENITHWMPLPTPPSES